MDPRVKRLLVVGPLDVRSGDNIRLGDFGLVGATFIGQSGEPMMILSDSSAPDATRVVNLATGQVDTLSNSVTILPQPMQVVLGPPS
jgi:hypothetical protein